MSYPDVERYPPPWMPRLGMDRSNSAAPSVSTMAYVDLDSYLVPITVVDLGDFVFGSVTDRSENGRLASVRPSDNKDPETAELLAEVFVITCVFCRHSGEGLSKEK